MICYLMTTESIIVLGECYCGGEAAFFIMTNDAFLKVKDGDKLQTYVLMNQYGKFTFNLSIMLVKMMILRCLRGMIVED